MGGFNIAFAEASEFYRPLGHLKGLLCSLLFYYNNINKDPPDEIYSLISELDDLRGSPRTQLFSKSEIDEEMSDLTNSLNSINSQNDKNHISISNDKNYSSNPIQQLKIKVERLHERLYFKKFYDKS